ncbi:MAG: cadmium-translocating P-type ATPase [Defluviitaleaceae bacterium]|nr:cadmium-translocating P-type ATPase [Defluviitaleaceae bacterium]
MKKEFVLQGLTCANCALKIEDSIKKTKGFLSANLNFTTGVLQLEILDSFPEDIHTKVEGMVHYYEPDVLVLGRESATHINHAITQKSKLLWLLVGGATFFGGVIFVWPYYLNSSVSFVLFAISYLLLGTKVVVRALKNITRGKIFDENFLMAIATLAAFAIGEYAGAATVMLLYQIGEYFQERAVRASKKEISELMNIRPDYANLQAGEIVKKVAPESVAVGSTIIVKPGEKIPIDGIVLDGESMLDTSALTGEAVPRKAKIADTVLSGCINQNGVLTIKTTQTFGESTASKIIDLVENAASKKATVETFITKFARWYTPTVVFLAVLVAVIPPLFFGGMWHDWIYRSIVLLIISCPCALVLSIPLGFFGGIGAASKRGVLVKGGNYLEALANLDMVVFDKTGTLTKGVFDVVSVQGANGFSEEELIELAAHAEAFSSHPIAISISKKHDGTIDKSLLENYNEISGHGVSVVLGKKNILAGNEKLMKMEGVYFTESPDFGTKVYVAVNGVYAGVIIISDKIKEDSESSIRGLKALGVNKTIMLTGDSQMVAEAVAKKLNIDQVHASLLPQEKVEHVEYYIKQKNPKKALAFVGDGINDAPVIAMADVGIAMGGLGSDAAIEASDVVLMTDEPQKLVEAIKVARFTKKIVWQNIVLSLGVQLVFLVLGTLGVASIWEAIFADVGMSLLAVFNTMRILRN